MSEEQLSRYIKRSKDRAAGLPFVLLYGPALSGKTELLRAVPRLAKTCFPKAQLACVSVDARFSWQNTCEPLEQLGEMLIKGAFESEAQLRVEKPARDFSHALAMIRDVAVKRSFWGVLKIGRA